MRPRGWSLQCPCMPGRGSPGSRNQPLRAATRREALPVRHAPTVRRVSGEPVRELLVSRRLELLGEHQHPGDLVLGALVEGGPAGRHDPRERRRPEQHVRELADRRSRAAPRRPWSAARPGPGGSATPATTCATCAVRRPASYSRATAAGSAYTHERSTNSRHRQPASESAGDPAHTSAIVSMPSVSARCSTRSATSGSSALRAPRTSRLAARSAASLTRAGSSPPMMSAKNSAPGFMGR